MSSVHSESGMPNLFCHFYDPEGFRKKVSTRTGNRRVAVTICTTIQRASELAKRGQLSNEKALKIMREAGAQISETHGQVVANMAMETIKAQLERFVKLAGGELESYTVRSWLDTWLRRKTDVSPATRSDYEGHLSAFLKYFGARADRSLTALQMRHCEEFKTYLLKRKSPSTTNKVLTILKTAFAGAVQARQIEFNPMEHVAFVESQSVKRRPFTADEIKKIAAVASGDWRTMVFLGLYTGLRLSDCANLTWREVQLDRGVIELETQKTGRVVAIPISKHLAEHLGAIVGDDPDAPLCPSLYAKRSGWLSNQFYKLMTAAGIVEPRDHQKSGSGRDGKHRASTVSFHCFRHNFVSTLKSAGVGDSVAQDLAGHESEAISRVYTKISESAKRQAIDTLPDWTK